MPHSHPSPPREDDPCDVIRKAMRGHELSETELAHECNLSPTTIQLALQDSPVFPTDLSPEDLGKIATTLGLNPTALANLPDYLPHPAPPEELVQIVTPFGHAGVNAFILVLGRRAIVFDTGTDATPILSYIKSHRLTLDSLYITHGHHDHISGLADFPGTPLFTAENLEHNARLSLGNGIKLTALDTSGHFTPSLAYMITGLSQPLCICGDIIFAGSIGKTANRELYLQSLDHTRENLMTLPPETILCPGHGPLTTVRQEAEHNPFLA